MGQDRGLEVSAGGGGGLVAVRDHKIFVCVQLDGVFQRLSSYREDETTGQVFVDGEDEMPLDKDEPIEGLTFSLQNRASAAGSQDDRVELVPGGAQVPVTFASRKKYRSLVLRHYTRECDVQVGAIRRGLISVVPAHMLLVMTGVQLRSRVCGQVTFDLEMLKTKLTIYSTNAWSKSDSVKWMWQALEQMSHRRRSLFFRFATGLSRLPLDPSAVMWKMEVSEMGKTDALPISHTCSCNIEVRGD